MVVGYEFQSQPCLTIQHTNGERLEGLKCCELPESVSTRSIRVRKVGLGQANFNPTHDPKLIVVIILEPRYQSHPYPTIHYTCNEVLEGPSCCEILESI